MYFEGIANNSHNFYKEIFVNNVNHDAIGSK